MVGGVVVFLVCGWCRSWLVWIGRVDRCWFCGWWWCRMGLVLCVGFCRWLFGCFWCCSVNCRGWGCLVCCWWWWVVGGVLFFVCKECLLIGVVWCLFVCRSWVWWLGYGCGWYCCNGCWNFWVDESGCFGGVVRKSYRCWNGCWLLLLFWKRVVVSCGWYWWCGVCWKFRYWWILRDWLIVGRLDCVCSVFGLDSYWFLVCGWSGGWCGCVYRCWYWVWNCWVGFLVSVVVGWGWWIGCVVFWWLLLVFVVGWCGWYYGWLLVGVGNVWIVLSFCGNFILVGWCLGWLVCYFWRLKVS